MKLSANGLSIEVRDEGPPQGPPLLLIMGLGMQLIAWPDELVAELVRRGFRVIRLDNRDVGLSQHLDAAGLPSLPWAMLSYSLRLPVRAPYSLSDMAADALGVLDALGLASAHICGASMGGMIAQRLAAQQPQRVKSLSLIMTSAGARHLPQPDMAIRRALIAKPAGRDADAVVDHGMALYRLIGSPACPADPQRLRERLMAAYQRDFYPLGTGRQLLAVLADGDRTPLLAAIQAPTRVIHGLADPLVPVAAGRHLAQHIAGAQIDLIEGMGHDLPLPLLARIAQGIADNAARA